MAEQKHVQRREGEERGQETTRQRGGTGTELMGRETDFFRNPFSVMRQMHDEMDRIFGDVFSGFGGGLARGAGGAGGGMMQWSPAIEVSQQNNQMKICAELPGIKPSDVKVELTEGNLIIQGERKEEREETEGGMRRSERRYGRFYRSIPLPQSAQADQAKAQFENGLLEITIPVPEESKRRQIPINASSQPGERQEKQSGRQPDAAR